MDRNAKWRLNWWLWLLAAPGAGAWQSWIFHRRFSADDARGTDGREPASGRVIGRSLGVTEESTGLLALLLLLPHPPVVLQYRFAFGLFFLTSKHHSTS
jgi:hypothetical protein